MESTVIEIATVRSLQPMRRVARLPARSASGSATPPSPLAVQADMPVTPATELPAAFWSAPEPDEQRRDAAARQDAQQILGDLGRVQADLLSGRVDVVGLRRIAMLANGLAPADPDLGDICKAIAIRARVEVARVEYARIEGASYQRTASLPRQPFY